MAAPSHRTVDISLLGAFRVTVDGAPVTGFRSDKARGLLAYLVVEADQPHTRDKLAGLFWPEWPDREARTYLRHALSNLRSILDDGVEHIHLEGDRQIVQLVCDDRVWVDVRAFDAALGRGTVRQDEASLSDLLALREAVSLYRGPFMDGFSLRDCAAFEEWLLNTRERLAQQMLAALTALASDQEARGNLDDALGYARRLLEIDPLREDAHRCVMRLLAHAGQRTAALVQFETCRRLLADELAVEPSEETLALHRQIQREEPIARNQVDDRVHAVAGRGPGVVHNLPAQPTPFVGRVRELAQVAETLGRPDCRLLTVVGPGGMGKTRLAVEAVQTLAHDFADGVWFVDLAPADAGALLPALLLKRLEAPESGPADAAQRLLAHLADKRLLLVLDNFEQLVDSADLVSDLLAAAPGVKVLVTSRAALRLREEWLHPLDGLELPPLERWNVRTFQRSTCQPATCNALRP